MATLSALPGGLTPFQGGTGNFTSDVLALPGPLARPGVVSIDSTAGATPTVTVAIQASIDGTTWYAAPYGTAAAPQTVAVATFAITTTTVTIAHLLLYGALFYRVNFTANTNVTINNIKWLV